jgi:hypothetical protein
MACRNALFQVEQIEQLALIATLPAHHDPPPSLTESDRRNHESPEITNLFQQHRPSSDMGRTKIPRRSDLLAH